MSRQKAALRRVLVITGALTLTACGSATSLTSTPASAFPPAFTMTEQPRVTCMFQDYDGTTEVGITANSTSCLLLIQVLSRAGRTWYPVSRMDKFGTSFGPGGTDGTEAQVCDLTDSTGTEELLVDDVAVAPYDVSAADVCTDAESGVIGAVANGSGPLNWMTAITPGPLAVKLQTPA